MSRRYLVTGGAGFIGSNLILRLIRTRPEIEVVNLDLLTYAGKTENLAEVAEHPRYRFVRGDICDATLVSRLMREMDAVINLDGLDDEEHDEHRKDRSPQLREQLPRRWERLSPRLRWLQGSL